MLHIHLIARAPSIQDVIMKLEVAGQYPAVLGLEPCGRGLSRVLLKLPRINEAAADVLEKWLIAIPGVRKISVEWLDAGERANSQLDNCAARQYHIAQGGGD